MESTGRIDVNGKDVCVGDRVFCWDGRKDQSEVTAYLAGVVTKVTYSDEIQYEVDGNNLAIPNAEFIEILSKQDA